MNVQGGWETHRFFQQCHLQYGYGYIFTKWIRDIRDLQTLEGFFPDYAPQVGTFANFYNSSGWGDAGIIVPWRLCEHSGDTAVLSRQYEEIYCFHTQAQ
jgi:hypothetical protein